MTKERVKRLDNHVYPACANCEAVLMDIWVTEALPEPFLVQAKCPWCGDRSMFVSVAGLFHYGGAAIDKDDDETNDVPSTLVEGFDEREDFYLFEVRKANEKAVPVY